jgi:hypothetical protein
MKLISWNIRGLNSHSKEKLLQDIIIAEKPDIIMLQETKCETKEMDKLLWNPSSVTLEFFFTTIWSISTTYRLIISNNPRYLTNVYGPATPRDKNSFLRNLEGLDILTSGNKWILRGDFKMICNMHEKRGGTR